MEGFNKLIRKYLMWLVVNIPILMFLVGLVTLNVFVFYVAGVYVLLSAGVTLIILSLIVESMLREQSKG